MEIRIIKGIFRLERKIDVLKHINKNIMIIKFHFNIFMKDRIRSRMFAKVESGQATIQNINRTLFDVYCTFIFNLCSV